MKFSIIVPIFRVEAFLPACVNSILSQSFRDFELLLIDDGSDDNCPNMCDEYLSLDSRVRVVHKPNGGLVSSRIAGSMMARGDYVINVDGDDFVDCDYLLEMSNIIESFHPDMIVNGFTLYDEITKKTTKFINSKGTGLFGSQEIKGSIFYDDQKAGVNNGSISLSAWSKVVKREIYIPSQQKVNCRISKGEDSLLTVALFMYCQSIYISDYCGYFYRINEKSMMNTKTDKDFNELISFAFELSSLAEIVGIAKNQVFVCTYHRLYNLIDFYASILPKKQFFTALKTIPDELFKYTYDLHIAHPSFKDKIRLALIKKKRWSLYWLLNRLKKH